MGKGLLMEMPTGSPFWSRTLGIDKTAVVRHWLTEEHTVAFAGDGAIACLADAAQLTQVLLNLALNAVQACAAGERVAVSARAENAGARDWIIIDVEDNGPGVPREIRATLFDPLLTAATSPPLYCLIPRALPPTPPLPCVDSVWSSAWLSAS